MLLTDTPAKSCTGTYKRALKLMGNNFEITVIDGEERHANHCIDLAVDEIKRIERLLTTFDESSDVCLINKQAGIRPVKTTPEVIGLIERSIRISELTQGAFDISYGSIDKRFWNFDKTMTALPDPVLAKKSVHLINFRNIIPDPQANTVFLKEKGMRIGFGGIGKGYAAERAKLILQQQGISSGIVNAAGDLTTWGTQPNGKPWTIGIANPNAAHSLFSSFVISNKAVATSGNYEKFVLIGGKRYSHTIDPKTGYPVSGIKSVTIISPHAEIADAMATPVMVMGIKTGLELINQIKHLECIIIDEKDRLHVSNNIKPTYS
jgi:thiamine biosynthesis lipoprotein